MINQIKMEKHEQLRIIAGVLLIISGITHVLQLFWVGFEWHDISAAIYGITYGILGTFLLLFRENKSLAVIGAIHPAIGGILGLNRLIYIEIALHSFINWWIVWHVIADCFIVSFCIYSYIKLKKLKHNE